MAGHAAGQRFSISSVTALSKGASAANLFLAQLKKNIKKLEDTWGKFKSTPLDVAYLVRDLSFLSQLILQTIQDSQSTPQISPVLEGALRSCIDKSQELVDLSGKFTARFGRKSLSGSNLKALLSLFTDSKIRFLVTQLLLERRTKPISQSALAEELALLHARDIQAPSSTLQVKAIEPRTDSLLSFKCYSELVGREDVILNLDREFEDSSLVALVGPNGSGKSQIATEYALRFQNRHPESHVLWIYCDSRTAFEESYRAVAVKLRIPGYDDSKIDILDRVRRYLSQEKAGKWLLVLESADKTDNLWGHRDTTNSDQGNQQPIRFGTYLPSSCSGRTLCLSTDEQVGAYFPETPVTLDVKPLPESEAATLFQSKLPKDLDHPKIVAALAGVLDYSPLAICLAAAYMVMMRCDASQYIVSVKTCAPIPILQKSGRTNADQSSGSTDSSPKKAWSMSFEQIQWQHPQAANLLALMSMFHHRTIPKNLLYHAWKHGLVTENGERPIPDFDIEILPMPPDLVELKDRTSYLGFSMALATLESFLILQYDAIHEAYSMHRAVQSFMQDYLQSNGTLRSWRSKGLILLSSTTQSFRPPHKPHTRSRSNLLLHIAELVHHPHEGDIAGLAKARIMSDVGSWRYSLTQTGTATSLLRQAYDLQDKLLKPQDARTLRTLVSLADSTSVSDSPSAAVPLLVEAIGGLKHTLGPGNRKTIHAQLSLCANHVLCGNTEQASAVHYEAQAAASASLQITPEDRKRIVTRLSELQSEINFVLRRQGKRSLSESDLKKSKSRVSLLKQSARNRMSSSNKAFSSQSRVASLDSIVELREVDASRN